MDLAALWLSGSGVAEARSKPLRCVTLAAVPTGRKVAVTPRRRVSADEPPRLVHPTARATFATPSALTQTGHSHAGASRFCSARTARRRRGARVDHTAAANSGPLLGSHRRAALGPLVLWFQLADYAAVVSVIGLAVLFFLRADPRRYRWIVPAVIAACAVLIISIPQRSSRRRRAASPCRGSHARLDIRARTHCLAVNVLIMKASTGIRQRGARTATRRHHEACRHFTIR